MASPLHRRKARPVPLAPFDRIDALLPQEIALRAEMLGVEKTRRSALTLFVLAVLAGAFIAFGAMFATIVLAGADGMIPFGVGRFLAGLAFSVGLILVVVGGAELFTGNTLMVMALAAGKVSYGEMLRAWGIVYVGNFVGALGTAVLVFLSGQYLAGDGAVGLVALKLGVQKAMLPFDHALFLGILCNVLVCLAVWLSIGARSTADKILAIIFPISAFVAAGFEHSVANMYIMPLALFIQHFAPQEFWVSIAMSPAEFADLDGLSIIRNLISVTIGNIIGGGFLVGLVYWFVYLRTR